MRYESGFRTQTLQFNFNAYSRLISVPSIQCTTVVKECISISHSSHVNTTKAASGEFTMVSWRRISRRRPSLSSLPPTHISPDCL
jgi:hypothetical protein